MKETVNVSIASQAFTVDEDAWRLLDAYLKSIRERIEPDDTETLADVEARIADLFRENLPSPIMVVTASMVRDVMNLIGSPDVFGTPHGGSFNRAEERSGRRRADHMFGGEPPLRRSLNDRVLAGVCGGIAEHFGCDAATIRLVTLILIVFGGLSAWLYIILWIVIPAECKN